MCPDIAHASAHAIRQEVAALCSKSRAASRNPCLCQVCRQARSTKLITALKVVATHVSAKQKAGPGCGRVWRSGGSHRTVQTQTPNSAVPSRRTALRVGRSDSEPRHRRSLCAGSAAQISLYTDLLRTPARPGIYPNLSGRPVRASCYEHVRPTGFLPHPARASLTLSSRQTEQR